jgi:hypothetical protein
LCRYDTPHSKGSLCFFSTCERRPWAMTTNLSSSVTVVCRDDAVMFGGLGLSLEAEKRTRLLLP